MQDGMGERRAEGRKKRVIEVDEEDSEEEADVNADVDGIGNNAVKNCVHHFGTTIC